MIQDVTGIFGVIRNCFLGAIMIFGYSMMGRTLCSSAPPFDNDGACYMQQVCSYLFFSYYSFNSERNNIWFLYLPTANVWKSIGHMKSINLYHYHYHYQQEYVFNSKLSFCINSFLHSSISSFWRIFSITWVFSSCFGNFLLHQCTIEFIFVVCWYLI